MGAFATRQTGLTRVDTLEQFSTWQVTIVPTSMGHSGTDYGGHAAVVPGLNGKNVRIRFFLESKEHWHGSQKSYGIRWLSLYVVVEGVTDDQWHQVNSDEVVIGMKIRKRINGEEDGGMDKKVVCGGSKILLEENFVLLAFLKKGEDGGRKDKWVYKNNGGMELEVNFALKILYARNASGDEAGFGGKCDGAVELLKDLRKLSVDSGLSDVALRSKDGVLLKAHKAILAARSPYFRRCILWGSTAYFGKEPVSLEDVRGRPLIALLHWMYTGELVEDLEEFLEELVQVATKFEMENLLKVLEKRKLGQYNGNKSQVLSREKTSIKKLKRAVLAWFPLLRYQFGQRPVGLVASVINGVYAIYELF